MNTKKQIMLILSILIVLLSFTNCSNDEFTYSCDKEINELIKEDLTKYSSMTRTEWKSLPDSIKIPVYRTFSPEQCRVFWKEKEQELMILKWSNLEKNHIRELYSKIDEIPDLFTSKYFDNETLVISWNNFLIRWVTYGKDVLNWDYAMLYGIASSGEEYSDHYIENLRNLSINDSIFNAPYGGGTGYSGGEDCNCHSWFWCQFLRPSEWECKESGCKASSRGCGTLFLQSCDGKCELSNKGFNFNFNNGGLL